MPSELTPAQLTLRARIAAHERWARTPDRSAATAAARAAADDRFTRQAREQFGDLPAEELAVRAQHLRRAHMCRMALASARSRRAKKTRGGGV